MDLKTIQNAMVAAMKAGQKGRKGVLSELVAAIKKAAIDKKCKEDIPDLLVAEVLLKEKKSTEEMIKLCHPEREDLLVQYNLRLSIIEEFAPKVIESKDEIKKEILSIVGAQIEFSKKNKGLLMKTLSKELKGKANMKIVNEVLEEMLV